MLRLDQIKETLRAVPPKALQPLALVPQRLQRPVVEFALREYFRDAMEDGRLSPLEGRWIRLEVADLSLGWLIGVIGNRPVISLQDRDHEVLIRGTLEEFLLLASVREDPDTQFFRRRIIMEGDTDLGLEVKNLIYSLDPERLPALINLVIDRLGWLVQRSRT